MSATSPGCGTAVRQMIGYFDHPALKAVADEPFPTSYTERYKRLAAVNRRNEAITTALGWTLDGPAQLRERMLRGVVTDGTSYDAILDDDTALGEYLRATVTGIWHASGTCRMGDPRDPLAVDRRYRQCDRCRRAAGLRCVDHADDPLRESERADHDDGRAYQRPDPERGVRRHRRALLTDDHRSRCPRRGRAGPGHYRRGRDRSRAIPSSRRCSFLAEQQDEIRKLMLREPRGYPGLCCNLLVPPTDPMADMGFIIMEQMEYPAMSGSNTICVATVLLETGILPMTEPVTELTLESPAGLVKVRADCADGKVTRVTFENVPAFALHLNVPVEVPNLGTIKVDVAWGGMMYVLFEGWQVGLNLTPDEGADCVKYGEMVKAATREQYPSVHPEHPGLDRPDDRDDHRQPGQHARARPEHGRDLDRRLRLGEAVHLDRRARSLRLRDRHKRADGGAEREGQARAESGLRPRVDPRARPSSAA